MASRKQLELVQECKRFSESCLYTSTSLFIWLRFRRLVKAVFIVVPLVLGSVASLKLLTGTDVHSVKVFASICAFIAGLMPSIYAALKFDDQLETSARAAGEFKNLQDRFRQVGMVSSRKPFDEFESEFRELMERLETVRANSITAPEHGAYEKCHFVCDECATAWSVRAPVQAVWLCRIRRGLDDPVAPLGLGAIFPPRWAELFSYGPSA